MEGYVRDHENFVYSRNESYLFDNQLEALKLASGIYLKFINHRGIFEPGALQKMIDVLEEYSSVKPVIYFANGVLKKDVICDNFNRFVRELGIYASWTTGVGIWKEDYDKLPADMKYDKISPHSCILFSERKKNCYVINNMLFSHEITTDQSKKGKYDVFKAFAVEEPTITLNLFIDGDITSDTLKSVIKGYRKFVSSLYWDYCIRKKPCSYELNGFDNAMGVFMDKGEVIMGAYIFKIKSLFERLFSEKKQ